MSYKNISDDNLILQTESEVCLERRSTLKIIKLFQEIYDRKLYLERGFPSFYEMVTKHFGYCAGSAMRRINAMKLVKEMPQFEQQLETGELALSVAADVQTFLYQEAKIERPYSMNAKIELVETCLGKTRREVEEEFAKRNPEREKRESSYAIAHDRLRVSFSISKELNDKLNHLKDLLSHVDPAMTTEALVERLAELGLDKYDPQRKAARAQARTMSREKNGPSEDNAALSARFRKGVVEEEHVKEKAASSEPAAVGDFTSAAEVKRTRYIAANERHSVGWTTCSYVHAQTGRACGSKKFLQLDHIRPFSRGGSNEATNLRWMCGAHNRLRWQGSHFQ